MKRDDFLERAWRKMKSIRLPTLTHIAEIIGPYERDRR